jgi:serralysin
MAEGNSGTTNFSFTVTKGGSTSREVQVDYATMDGSATGGATQFSGGDYVAQSGRLTFAPNQMSMTITIQVVGDTADNADENFFVNLSNATNATITDAQGEGTIQNDDSQITINDVRQVEGTSGQNSSFVFTVTKTGQTSLTATVNYATANGSGSTPATAGSDYEMQSGMLTFAPDQTTQTITVAVVADASDEPNEQFVVNLSGATNSRITDSQGVGTIEDDDGPVTLSINDVTKSEGTAGPRTSCSLSRRAGARRIKPSQSTLPPGTAARPERSPVPPITPRRAAG